MLSNSDPTSAVVGFGVGLSLIIAIGAQNAFVLRQGLTRSHVLPIILVCAVSDAILILAGISGIGALLEHAPSLITFIRIVGAVFLLSYAVFAAKRAFHPQTLAPDQHGNGSRLAAVTMALALTWLNPHVYLDTVVLMGSIANGRGEIGRWWFAAGAITASVGWFSGLGYGARLLTPLFAKPNAWRILDALIAVMMTVLGISLLTEL
ncbi:LysE/ArgO family amino acid transporter [Rhodococcus sp. IEGM 1379]|uniref:LysE/ArgO family amino acid transporter n=1 Tax=Rhodococcus sp. IEGM 1379 TaxID=3047086 RepID=UPI0024B864CF|nr:LysE/ArgO family amino acid transporter [Rhodococcus sp. IEGM 1379]MDI9913896.1 LysE/ArgO family amino acid transporter [Rhodococcus sp. IEGM 1379]